MFFRGVETTNQRIAVHPSFLNKAMYYTHLCWSNPIKNPILLESQSVVLENEIPNCFPSLVIVRFRLVPIEQFMFFQPSKSIKFLFPIILVPIPSYTHIYHIPIVA